MELPSYLFLNSRSCSAAASTLAIMDIVLKKISTDPSVYLFRGLNKPHLFLGVLCSEAQATPFPSAAACMHSMLMKEEKVSKESCSVLDATNPEATDEAKTVATLVSNCPSLRNDGGYFDFFTVIGAPHAGCCVVSFPTVSITKHDC